MANDSSINVETTHLRVYIHCEGCRKKVKKILSKIEGVCSVDINASVGKVSVTGTADPKLLMKKLQKSGKAVELWPSQPAVPATYENKKKEAAPSVQPSLQAEVTQPTKQSKQTGQEQHGMDKTEVMKTRIHEAGPENKENGDISPLQKEMKSSKKVACGNKESLAAIDTPCALDDIKPEPVTDTAVPCGSKTAGVGCTRSNDRDTAVNNSTSLSVAVPNTMKKGDPDRSADGHHVRDDCDDDNSAAADQESKRGETRRGIGVTKARLDEVGLVQPSSLSASSSSSTSSVSGMTNTNKLLHAAPPSMVLVETNEYSADMESIQEDEYGATHMFSDENANNCALM